MARKGKKYRDAAARVERRPYAVEEALGLVQEASFARFDETVEVSMRMGVNPRHADQMVRGTVVLPHGTGKTVTVLAVCEGEAQKQAEEAGADHVLTAEDAVEKIQGGWLEVDAIVATPDMMRHLSKVGRVLGPRGLMPNPKSGTVTPDVAVAIKDIKSGRVEFRVDKTAIIHAPVGKISFSLDKLVENTRSLVDAVQKAKPATAKGKYVHTIYLCSTMGPGVQVDPVSLDVK
ncbi:MAG: 50S ribosomal protein L1 [Thermoanaerobaculales bacterium]|jgi:large subunit ribosomal protein L1|nr:50S ribosomal protein L1 [Thermoanaerobaculales bacterium]